jgi:hypothetical protein
VTKATIGYLQKLMKEGKVIVVNNNSSITTEKETKQDSHPQISALHHQIRAKPIKNAIPCICTADPKLNGSSTSGGYTIA